ncbi:MAG: hypothetical protein WDZ90_03005 [Candidatus Paceibacterota bacterium]
MTKHIAFAITLTVVALFITSASRAEGHYVRMLYCDTISDAGRFAATLVESGIDAAIEEASYNGVLVNCAISWVDPDTVRLIESGYHAEFATQSGEIVLVEQIIVGDPWFERRQAVYRIRFSSDLRI